MRRVTTALMLGILSCCGAMGGGLVYKHYAWAHLNGYLDGPRREAMGRAAGPLDAEFNDFVGSRCIRAADGRVFTYMYNDYWPLNFGVKEGPAAYLPPLGPVRGTGYGQSVGGIIVKGLPLKGGGYGCVYVFSSWRIYRVWKNEEKGGRWWFKQIAGSGTAVEIPGKRVYQGQIWKDDRVVFFTKSGFYELLDGKDGVKFKCMLALKNIEDKLPRNEKGQVVRPTQGVVDVGGTFYLGYYFAAGAWGSRVVPTIQRVSPDGKKVEPYGPPHRHKARKGKDGPVAESGWHCGPHFAPPKAVSPWYPAGVLLCGAHDEHTLRRIKDGRTSTLCRDGEWRELKRYPGNDGYAVFVYGKNKLGLCQSGNEGMARRGEGLHLVEGIDIGKPTVATPMVKKK